MQSNKFIDMAKAIAERDFEVFETLMDFEKTQKIRTKTRLNFTIDKSLASRFKKVCRDKGYNMSSKIEGAIRGMIEEG